MDLSANDATQAISPESTSGYRSRIRQRYSKLCNRDRIRVRAHRREKTVNVSQDQRKTSVAVLEEEINKLIGECKVKEECVEGNGNFEDSLRSWALRHGITRQPLRELLQLLRGNGHEGLPLDTESWFRTPHSTKDDITKVTGGLLWYRGIANSVFRAIRKAPTYIKGRDVIEIDISSDGLSPYKSSKTHVWPILGRLYDQRGTRHKPFLIAVYSGTCDKPDLEEFLCDFIAEAQVLQEEGWEIQGKMCKLQIVKVIADAPARSHLKMVNPHQSAISCERCTAVSRKVRGMVFRQVDVDKAVLRTDSSYIEQSQPEYHRGASPFLEIRIGFVSKFPLDVMHLVYLGVVRRMFAFLFESKYHSRSAIKPSQQLLLTNHQKEMSKYYPSEFARKPRGFDEWKNFKATEWRRILFYDCLTFGEFLKRGVYRNFLLLHCAMRILSSKEMVRDEALLKDAEILLSEFVKHTAVLHGEQFVVYNVHNLTHLVDDVRRHGNVESFSAFDFESHLRLIKMAMRAPGRCAQQIINRLREKENESSENEEDVQTTEDCSENGGTVTVTVEHEEGPLNGLDGRQYKTAQLSDYTIRLRRKDNCILNSKGKVMSVKNIIKCGEEVKLVGHEFLIKSDFFNYPFKSSRLGIVVVSSACDELSTWDVREVQKKCVLLPTKSKGQYLCIPMNHVQEEVASD